MPDEAAAVGNANITPMGRAFRLARQALGSTSPNPAVGAVVVRQNTVVGEGFTLPPGGSHAEIVALQQAGAQAQGADLYTTLEPCCTHGRTPPCTLAIVAAGIKRVFVAARDPNPRVYGKGCQALEAAGIEVHWSQGEDAETAEELYQAFGKHVKTGLPFITAKFAMSLDGKIATNTGDSKWITGTESRALVHELRRESDAIMVGVNTVLADDPQLTARYPSGEPLSRQPIRAVLDSSCRTPPESKMFKEPGTTLIAVCSGVPASTRHHLEAAGAEVFQTPPGADGRVDLDLVMKELGRRGVVTLLVEGGGEVLGSLFDRGYVDRVLAFVAPVIIGGSGAASPVGGAGVSKMAGAWHMDRSKMQPVGSDWLITGYPK